MNRPWLSIEEITFGTRNRREKGKTMNFQMTENLTCDYRNLIKLLLVHQGWYVESRTTAN